MKNNRNSLIFIFITVLVDVIGIGIIIPIIPTLIKNLTGTDESGAAVYGGFLILAFAVMQFLFAPLVGELSDRYGRRPVLLIALLGLGLDYVFHAYAPTITLLFVGRFIAGITGASFTVANAYVADISAPEDKAKNFGLIGAAFGLGFIIGPLIGGLAGGYWGPQAPFLIAAGLTLLNFLYGLFILPESLPKEKRRKFEWKRANPISPFLFLRRYPVLTAFAVVLFLNFVAGHALQSTWTFFTEYTYGWTVSQVGWSLTAVGLLVAIVQAGLVGRFVKWLGELRTIQIGFLLWIGGMLLFAFATEGWMLYAFLVPYALGGIAGPTLQGLISNQVPENEQGELQGALTSLTSLTGFVGPLLMTNVFAAFTGEGAIYEMPGAAFVLGAAFLLVSTIIVWRPLKRLAKGKA